MKIGDLVKSPIYQDKDQGRIINILSLDDTSYYEIYFPKTKETLTLEEKDVQKITTPLENLQNKNYDPSALLKLRILSERIDSLLYQDKLITANNFKIVPLPHQVLAVNNVIGKFMPRCLIADEVGLGKTIEAALIYEELKLRNMVNRILIITPAGLTVQWRDELKTKFNEDFSIIDRNTFKALRDLHGNINVWKKFDRIITSLDFLKPRTIRNSMSESLAKRREEHNQYATDHCINAHWDMVIFDEAHKLSKDSEGSETSRYKLGKSLADTVPIFLILTATPHQGDSEKFRHLLNLIDEYKFYSPEMLTPDNVRSVTVKNKKRAAVDFKGNLIFKSRITSLVKIERDEKDIEVDLYNAVTDYVSQYYKLASRAGNFPFMFLLILYQRMVSSSSRAIYNSLSHRLQSLTVFQKSVEKVLNSLDVDDIGDL
ncbi:DEAD/DEAH box helicase, partial [Candidatus Poribacteria bacterium]